MVTSRFDSLLPQFREALEDCRRLYVSAGETCAREHPHLLGQDPSQFVQMMDDLHRGLLVKVFITVSQADRRWSANEQLLAELLFAHVWNRYLTGDDLRDAISKVSQKSLGLKWYSLFRPFDQVAPLRDRVGDLETVVLRVANIVAQADKAHCTKGAAHVKMIQDELFRHLRPIPIDEPGQHAAADALGGQAIQSVRQEAGKLRQEYELAEQESAAPVDERTREERLAEALAELDGLIGLDTVKHEVRTLINFLKVQERRKEAGLPATSLSLHMVFHGNPGTGKTSVARILGKVFGALGVLQKGHLVETDRSGLVAEYAGQTGPKTNKKIDEAADGVLFIDEAYSLVAEEGDDPFGREAVQTLLKRMEDDRERLVVILAGYPREMEVLLASNPGLSSRFGRQLAFPDYSPAELGSIFGRLCKTNHYELPRPSRVKLLLGLKWLYDRRDRHFGNGRTVRNLFEQAIRRLANRIAHMPEITRIHLTVFCEEDIDFAAIKSGSPPADLFDNLSDEHRPFAVTCPGCREATQMPQKFLMRRVKCRCGHRFTIEWAEPA